MHEEIAVYKLQDRNMGEKECSYSKRGVLEAHYYFAKNNDNKFLFTTESNLIRKDVEYVLLVLSDGQYGFLSRIKKKGTYPDVYEDSSYTVPTQWKEINKNIEQLRGFNWIALELVSKIVSNIEGIPTNPSPQYMPKEMFSDFFEG
ncbi:hypothetical protein [Streptococcus anginosus]|uniref:hypothetical protein n=1 Tax=Streptococcus anginosus TaxID=1328 RepID=UPI000D0918C8|nr:hypothetical protein [Streptococcus anginosus]PRT67319.1 hypothetical protein C6A29_03750 [Streptococcus anginosus]